LRSEIVPSENHTLRVHVVIFWIMKSCSGVVGYQRFEGPYCFNL